MTFRVVSALLACLLLSATPARAAGKADPWAYFGLYRLQDGAVFQGGLLEEGDADLWIFGSPTHPQTGGLVYRRQPDGTFTSLVRPGRTLRFSNFANGAYQRLVLDGGESEPAATVSGTRIAAIVRRDVQIPARGGPLHGTLLTPTCAGPHPLIVFVGGSGLTTRHIGELGTYFLSKGLALLTYDKRDGDPGTEGWQEPSLTDLGADAAAVLAFAALQPEADKDRTGIFASSQGAWTGTMAAVTEPGADFLIVRAGPGVSESETHLYEVRGELTERGLAGRDLESAVSLHRELYDAALRGESIEAADALAAPWLDSAWYRTAFGDKPISRLWSPRWWKWVGGSMAVSAMPYLERFEGPVLWFLGAEDENVPLVSSHAALTRSFARMRGGDHQVVVLPEAPHSFVLGMQTTNPRYAPGYLATLEDWLGNHGLKRPGCTIQ